MLRGQGAILRRLVTRGRCGSDVQVGAATHPDDCGMAGCDPAEQRNPRAATAVRRETPTEYVGRNGEHR